VSILKLCLGGVILSASLCVGEASACPPAVALRGPERAVREVATLLRSQGVTVGDSPCAGPTLEVSIAPVPSGGGFVLRVAGGHAWTGERRVANSSSAASLVESWVMDEDADLIAPPVERRSLPEAEIVMAPAQPDQIARSRWLFLAALEASAATDASMWYGVSLNSCRFEGPACLGGRLRLAHDNGWSGTFGDGETRRTAGDLLLSATLPLPVGAVTIAPLVGVGARLTDTMQPSWLGDSFGSRVDLAVTVEVALLAAVPVTRRWAVIGEVGSDIGYHAASTLNGPLARSLPAPPGGELHGAFGCQYTP
jgi:hypothetical protein